MSRAAQRIHLTVHVTAVRQQSGKDLVRTFCETEELLADLLRLLTRQRQHWPLDAPMLGIHLCQQWQAKRRRIARAGLRMRDEVAPSLSRKGITFFCNSVGLMIAISSRPRIMS